MNARAMIAVVRKDLMVVSRNKNLVIPMLIVMLVFFVIFPFGLSMLLNNPNGLGDNTSSIKELLATLPVDQMDDSAGYTDIQKAIVFNAENILMPFFLLVPLMVAAMIAADSFAGEKERKTLEALLYTPTTDRELFLAKMLSGWLASIAVSLVGLILYSISVNTAAWPQMQRIFFPNALWVVMVVWMVPALSGLGVGVMVVVSSRAQGFQDANQMAGLVVLPIFGLFYAQMMGAIILNISILILMGLGLWLLTGLCIWFGSKSFHRVRILTA